MAEPPIRKMARHDIKAVRTFLARAERDRRGTFHVDKEMHDLSGSDFLKVFPEYDDGRRTDDSVAVEDGALFYAATVNADQTKDVFVTVYIRTDFPDDARGQGADVDLENADLAERSAANEAVICHVAYEIPKLRTHEVVLSRLFSAMERFAASQAKDALRVSLRHTSFLIHHHLSKAPYHVDSYSISAERQVLITFKRPLVRDFRGDVLDWTDLTEWYLRFSYPKLKASDLKPKPLHRGVLEYSLSLGQEFTDHPAVRDQQCAVPMRVVTVAADGDLARARAAVEAAHGHFPLLLVETEQPKLRDDGRYTVKTRPDLERAVATVKKFYLNGAEYDPSVDMNELRWEHWWTLKAGKDVAARSGVVVEIDHRSYVDLLRKVGRETKPESGSQSFLFLNHGGFAEQGKKVESVFFFAWDANHLKKGEHGVLCAVGTLVNRTHYTLDQLHSEWHNIKHRTIYQEENFPSQYFKGSAVALEVKDLRGEWLTADGTGGISTGVPYADLLKTLTGVETKGRQPEPERPILPVWGIGNTYLSKTQVTKLEQLLVRTVDKDRWFSHKPPPPPPASLRPSSPVKRGGGAIVVYGDTYNIHEAQNVVTRPAQVVQPGLREPRDGYEAAREGDAMSEKYKFGNVTNVVTEPTGPVTFNQQTTAAAASELAQLRTALEAKPNTPETEQALTAVSGAEQAAKNNDANGMFAKLRTGGTFLLGVAKEVGVKLLVDKLEGK